MECYWKGGRVRTLVEFFMTKLDVLKHHTKLEESYSLLSRRGTDELKMPVISDTFKDHTRLEEIT